MAWSIDFVFRSLHHWFYGWCQTSSDSDATSGPDYIQYVYIFYWIFHFLNAVSHALNFCHAKNHFGIMIMKNCNFLAWKCWNSEILNIVSFRPNIWVLKPYLLNSSCVAGIKTIAADAPEWDSLWWIWGRCYEMCYYRSLRVYTNSLTVQQFCHLYSS